MDTIEIKKGRGPILDGFKLGNLKDMNVIVGKNNTGKTKFFESVKEQYKNSGDVKVIYITARDVKPEDELKTSADSSNFVRNLEEILTVLGHQCPIPPTIVEDCAKIIDEANNIFQSITGDASKFAGTSRDMIDLKWVIRSAIETNSKKIAEEGQGHQRLVIASFLNACAGQVSNLDSESEILILFEEPELYLHPALKRELNKMLRRISQKDKYQVIISTHDPYFLWVNMDDNMAQTYSFEIDKNGKTKSTTQQVGLGVEDEMLFITLYSKALKKHGMDVDTFDTHMQSNHKGAVVSYRKCEKSCGPTECNESVNQVSLVTYIRHQIHHPGNICNTSYTDTQLEQSIGLLAKEM